MNTTPTEREQIVSLSLRRLLSSFPIVGPILNDIFFEFKGKVKQERLNRFVDLLEDEFIKMNIDTRTLQTEEHLDLFESIFKKAAETRSEKKRIGFKNILIHGIKNNNEIEYCEIFSELLLVIRPKELEILSAHKHYLIDGKGPLAKKNELDTELNYKQYLVQNRLALRDDRGNSSLSREAGNAGTLLKQYQKECTPEKFGITKDELKYFYQNLLSKGLLRDDGALTHGTGATEVMSITNFGLKFLEFVRG